MFVYSAKDNLLTGVVDICASCNIGVVTEAIVDAVMSLNPKVRYVVGCDANFIWIWISRLPTSIGDLLMLFISKVQVPALLKDH